MANLSEDKGTSLRVDNALNYEIMRTMQTLDAGAELASLCYSKCILVPGLFLSPANTKCLENCVDRFMDVRHKTFLRFDGALRGQFKNLPKESVPQFAAVLARAQGKTEDEVSVLGAS